MNYINHHINIIHYACVYIEMTVKSLESGLQILLIPGGWQLERLLTDVIPLSAKTAKANDLKHATILFCLVFTII